MRKFWRYVYWFWQNVRTWQTDGHTQTHTAWRQRPRLHSIARQKSDSICQSYAQMKNGQVFWLTVYICTAGVDKLGKVCQFGREVTFQVLCITNLYSSSGWHDFMWNCLLHSSHAGNWTWHHVGYQLTRVQSFIKSAAIKLPPRSALWDQTWFQDWFHRHTPGFAFGYGWSLLCNYCCVQLIQCLSDLCSRS